MTDDREALINHLLKVNRRWRAVAIAAVVLVFVVLIPFTMGINAMTMTPALAAWIFASRDQRSEVRGQKAQPRV